MKKIHHPKLFVAVLLAAMCSTGCSKLFVSYCDRVAKGTADKSWFLDVTTNTVPFSRASYREAAAGSSGAVCVVSQGPSAEAAAGKNFSYELTDANDRVIAKRNGSAAARPINLENKPKLWGGVNQTNKNTFESEECFPVAKLDPFVKVKVKNTRTNETDESKLWNNVAFCKK